MADQQERQPAPALQAREQARAARPGYGVEGRGRLVGEEQRGPAAQGLRDRDALPLAAAELVRDRPRRASAGEAHLRQRGRAPRRGSGRGSTAGARPRPRRPAARPPHGVQRQRGVLEDERDLGAAARGGGPVRGSSTQLAAPEADRSPHDRRGRRGAGRGWPAAASSCRSRTRRAARRPRPRRRRGWHRRPPRPAPRRGAVVDGQVADLEQRRHRRMIGQERRVILRRPMRPPPGHAKGHDPSWPDARLVRECLRGSEEAWAALLDKYKNLIFSIPVKQGIPRDDAADIFQRVCLLLLAELPQLRKAEALPMWLIRVTSRECQRWRRQEQPYGAREDADAALALRGRRAPAAGGDARGSSSDEQMLRDAVRGLPPRCRELVGMLFFEDPPRPLRGGRAEPGPGRRARSGSSAAAAWPASGAPWKRRASDERPRARRAARGAALRRARRGWRTTPSRRTLPLPASPAPRGRTSWSGSATPSSRSFRVDVKEALALAEAAELIARDLGGAEPLAHACARRATRCSA